MKDEDYLPASFNQFAEVAGYFLGQVLNLQSIEHT